MINPIRKDSFDIPALRGLPSGYYKLLHADSVLPVSASFVPSLKFLNKNMASSHELDFYESDIVEHFIDGDIAFVNSRGGIRIVLSRLANHNTLLVTERCDNLCLFCSQPPKTRDDSWLFKQAAFALIEFKYHGMIGITGGEPLLYGEEMLKFLEIIAEESPNTGLHILTNGRKLSDSSFVKELADKCNKINITLGIPLYSCIEGEHDLLVNAEGAYRDTVIGIINAGNLGIPVEVRVIPTCKNLDRLVDTVDFITRVFSNIVQVSIMNLEPTGWAKHNWNDLYVPPSDYQDILRAAILSARRAGLGIRLFNYPLCHLDDELKSYSVQSISDWKNYYPDECRDCSLRSSCTGYFMSSKGIFHQPPRRII